MNSGIQELFVSKESRMSHDLQKIFIVIALLQCCYSSTVLGQEATQAGWSDDVNLLLNKILTIHPNPFRRYILSDWQHTANQLKKYPPVNDAKAALSLYQFLAMAADGHTEAALAPAALRGYWLPLIIRRFKDGWFVRTGHPRYRALFGKPITHVGGIPVDTVAKRLRPFVSCDNAIGALDGIGNLFRNAVVLEALEISPRDSVEITVQNEKRTGTPVTVYATSDSWVTAEWIDVDQELNRGQKPLYRRFDRNYDFEVLNEERIIYVWFSEIRDEDDETIAQFFSRVFRFIQENEVERFVLDLRENSGGNLELNGPVLHGLIACRKVNYPGGLYVIIGRDTYSAAMNLAVSLERHTYALFVGEPTGATPNHFGDTQKFTLPYSQLTVEISELYWQNSDPRDNRPWITPDIPVDVSFNDFIQHRDPALEAIRSFQTSDCLIMKFGPPLQRWRRVNQKSEEDWPSLLGTVE
jgi:hypothetical protein